MSSPHNIGIIADFNADNLVRMMAKHSTSLGATITAAPFGQAMQTLLQRSGEFWDRSYELIILWTFPGSVVPRFNDVLDLQAWSADELNGDVDAFADVVGSLRDRVGNVFVPTWVPFAFGAHRPSIEMNSGVGMTTALMRMNLRLADRLGSNPGVVLFNTERWLRQGGPGGFSDKLWYLSKTPYSKAVFEEAAKDLVATFRGIKGLRRKVVIVDLDNTLWGGVVGDIGWESIQLGGHDPIGEAYVEFQKQLKRLSREGVVLAVVSKNEEAIALDAIDKSPEMVLRSTDFAAWRINWADKAQNIAELMAELNLGLDAAVFIDDSPHERSRVRHALPDVLVPEWPTDPMDYARTMRELRCFESPVLSNEDRARTTMYVLDRERKALKVELGSVDKWLEMLDLEVHVEELSSATLERAAQLLNKTNQMNLATRRLSTHELGAWASEENHQVWTFRVRDKFGDYGLCGIASVAFEGPQAELVDFLLSCRVLGRGVEEAIISIVAEKARKGGAGRLTASYVATNKNRLCIRWIEEQRLFTHESTGSFVLDVEREVPAPRHICIAQSP